MLYYKTSVGRFQVPKWEEEKVINLTDSELLEQAVKENDHFCISPATYALIEKRGLEIVLQKLVNPSVGFNHETIRMVDGW